MKKILIGLVVVVSFLMTSCGDIDELPPKTRSIHIDYMFTPAKQLTSVERDYIDLRRDEYLNSINK